MAGTGAAANHGTVVVNNFDIMLLDIPGCCCEENSPAAVVKISLLETDSIAVMLLGLDKIRKVKEEKGATIWFEKEVAMWFRSFDIVEDELVAIWFERFDIGEGSLYMVILGVYPPFMQGKTKATKCKERRDKA